MIALLMAATGCQTFHAPSLGKFDMMSAPPTHLIPGLNKQSSPYQMRDGSVPAEDLSADGSLTMEAYQKIREAKAQNAVVLQVAGDPEPVRLLPLPPNEKSVFVSELLTQTGVIQKFGAIEATLYRPAPNSISGVKMEVKFNDDGNVDPANDYGLRPGDRVQVRQKSTTMIQSLVNLALRR